MSVPLRGCQDCGWTNATGLPHSFCNGKIVYIVKHDQTEDQMASGVSYMSLEDFRDKTSISNKRTDKTEVRNKSITDDRKKEEPEVDLISVGPFPDARHYLNPPQTEVRTTSVSGGQKGVKLERFDLIPVGPLTHLARHYGRGADKYADHQWRKGIDWSKLYAALQRHLTAFWDGIELDTCPSTGEGCAFVTIEGEPFEGVPGVSCYNHTGSHHLDAVMWMAFALRDGVDNHPELDDRYKKNNFDGQTDDRSNFHSSISVANVDANLAQNLQKMGIRRTV